MNAEQIQKRSIEFEDSKVTALASPQELGEQRKRLVSVDVTTIDAIGVVSGDVQQYVLPSGALIEGVDALDVVIGGEHTNAHVRILDLTHTNKYAVVGEGDHAKRMRCMGKNSQGGDACAPANFAVVVLDDKGKPVSMQALMPNRMLSVGRDPGKIGGVSLPETVSRDHIGLSIDQEGKLTIENHNPANATYIEQTSGNIKRGREDVADYVSDTEFDLRSAEPMVDAEATAAQLSVIGEVIGQVSSLQAPYIDSLIVRKLDDDEGLHVLVIEKRDETLTIRELKDNSEIGLPGMNTNLGALLQRSGDRLQVTDDDASDFGGSGVEISFYQRKQLPVYKRMPGELKQDVRSQQPRSRHDPNYRIAHSTLDGGSGFTSKR